MKYNLFLQIALAVITLQIGIQSCSKGEGEDLLVNSKTKYFFNEKLKQSIAYSVTFDNGTLRFGLPKELSRLDHLKQVKFENGNIKLEAAIVMTNDFNIIKEDQKVKPILETRSWPFLPVVYHGYLYYSLVNSPNNEICAQYGTFVLDIFGGYTFHANPSVPPNCGYYS